MVSDGYSAYHKMDRENPDIVFAGCYAHCRRKFSDVLKGLNGKQKESAKDAVAYQALEQIAAIYHLDNQYSELEPEDEYSCVRKPCFRSNGNRYSGCGNHLELA